MNRKREASSPLHLNIGRIVVDADALGDVSRSRFRAEIGTALSQHLSGQTIDGPPTLAQQIARSVAPQVRAQLPKGGRNGA
ncbi:MAG TPA: hypothetical protein VGM72_09635 [Micropepsaceae bacterium]|jgi:hypothetical protein